MKQHVINYIFKKGSAFARPNVDIPKPPPMTKRDGIEEQHREPGLAIELLRDIMQKHADTEDADYNGCDLAGEECKWCVDAEAWIKKQNA
jgi:hypothetical protein